MGESSNQITDTRGKLIQAFLKWLDDKKDICLYKDETIMGCHDYELFYHDTEDTIAAINEFCAETQTTIKDEEYKRGYDDGYRDGQIYADDKPIGGFHSD